MARLVLAALVLALLAPASGRAQVNAERLRASATDEGPYLRLDGALTWMRGNIDFLSASANIFTGVNRGKHHFLTNYSASYAEASKSPYLSRAFAHMRWTAAWHERVASEVFAQAQYDSFLFLRVRALGGAGARLTLHDDPDVFSAHAATGYMLEREVFQDSAIPEGEPHPQASTNHRWTSYFTFTVRADEMLSFTNTVYVQPRFDEFSDYRVAEEAALTLSHESGLALSFGLRMRFDSDPPQALARLDVNLFTTLGIQLQRADSDDDEDEEGDGDDSDGDDDAGA
ncbi:MAG TPA: DUF481 domain-containing protein [Polyangiaceae bacterium LLY-WYZ-15_(1-7)]|nr:hypothetical protein [Myxococcales bacterium]MAT25304.1 hypothetical protein [Sandaracinus sp.]HJK92411.1 DUF481 domain-containing protein [Polyangiaceae bacterium LLY-WYZ-15_(1-7)]MBJ71369.1 hypothetical protein [Sandaracinus sp.]HJL06496.1 DUF481 domain-containing protein [Polyangiaceae bacterium LLY-WYZ-15_(1-7)]